MWDLRMAKLEAASLLLLALLLLLDLFKAAFLLRLVPVLDWVALCWFYLKCLPVLWPGSSISSITHKSPVPLLFFVGFLRVFSAFFYIWTSLLIFGGKLVQKKFSPSNDRSSLKRLANAAGLLLAALRLTRNFCGYFESEEISECF